MDSIYVIVYDILKLIRKNNVKAPITKEYDSIYSILVEKLQEYEIEGEFDSVYEMVLALNEKITNKL